MLPLRVALLRTSFGRVRNSTAFLSGDGETVGRAGYRTPTTMRAPVSERLSASVTKPPRSWRTFGRKHGFAALRLAFVALGQPKPFQNPLRDVLQRQYPMVLAAQVPCVYVQRRGHAGTLRLLPMVPDPTGMPAAGVPRFVPTTKPDGLRWVAMMCSISRCDITLSRT